MHAKTVKLACWLCALLTMFYVGIAFGASCGSTPGKPSTPAGCVGLVLTCMCDADGKNCTWRWVCQTKRTN